MHLFHSLVSRPLLRRLAVAGAAVIGTAWGQGEGLEFDGFSARMALEAGHLVRGEFLQAGKTARHLHFIPLNRNIIFLDQSGRIGEDWRFSAGLMGVLWWPFTPEIGPPATRTMRVDPRVSVLRARLNFGKPGRAESDRSYFEFGYFPYKYNSDAVNLGEYLYRSGTYPGIVSTTDGYQLMGSPVHYAYGAHLRLSQAGGRLHHDFNLFTEPVTEPVGDLTPAYEISFGAGVLQVGGGLAWNRGLSYRPSQTRPKSNENAYIRFHGDPVKGIAPYEGPYLGAPNELLADPSLSFDTLHHWTHRGVKIMARAVLDLGLVLPESMRSPGDLRLFTEVAVLGWSNQPYYYENRWNRIPVMVGMNLPTFTMLDLLALQVEWYDALFNDTYDNTIKSLPIWKVKDYQTKDLNLYDRSPWRWSLNARKSLNRLAGLSAQVASDHLRMRDLLTSPTEYELTLHPKNWYYLFRLEVGI